VSEQIFRQLFWTKRLEGGGQALASPDALAGSGCSGRSGLGTAKKLAAEAWRPT
jgi:hypothetical protein